MMNEANAEMTIRAAAPDDVPMIRACVQAAYALYRDRLDREPAPMLADYDALVARNVVWVLDTSEGLQGVIVMFPQANTLFIENLAVAPAAQGCGYGKTLLQFAETHAHAHGLNTLSLYTNAVMTENLSFYARLGFAETDRRLEHGYHRVFLEKPLGINGSERIANDEFSDGDGR